MTGNVTGGSTLAGCATRLRAAIESEDYDRAEELLAEYRRRFDEGWSELSGDPGQASLKISESLSVLTWALKAVAAGRALAAHQLSDLPSSTPYSTRTENPRSTWRFSA